MPCHGEDTSVRPEGPAVGIFLLLPKLATGAKSYGFVVFELPLDRASVLLFRYVCGTYKPCCFLGVFVGCACFEVVPPNLPTGLDFATLSFFHHGLSVRLQPIFSRQSRVVFLCCATANSTSCKKTSSECMHRFFDEVCVLFWQAATISSGCWFLFLVTMDHVNCK